VVGMGKASHLFVHPPSRKVEGEQSDARTNNQNERFEFEFDHLAAQS